MNGFVIALGAFIISLSTEAINIANEIGKVDVEMGGTSCVVPYAPEYIKKLINKGNLGRKRKMARC